MRIGRICLLRHPHPINRSLLLHVQQRCHPCVPYVLFSPLLFSFVFSILVLIFVHTPGGSLTLASSDPFAAPLIDPGLLNSDFDIFCMVEAIKAMQTYATASAFDGYLLEPYGPFADAVDDASIEAYARNYTTTVRLRLFSLRCYYSSDLQSTLFMLTI